MKDQGEYIIRLDGCAFAVQDSKVIHAESRSQSPIFRYVIPWALHPSVSTEVGFVGLYRSHRHIDCSSYLSRSPSFAIRALRLAHRAPTLLALTLLFPACKTGIDRAFLIRRAKVGLPDSPEIDEMVD